MKRHTIPTRRSHTYSARQRLLCITFDTVEDAEAWDRAGRPLYVLTDVDDADDDVQSTQRRVEQSGSSSGS